MEGGYRYTVGGVGRVGSYATARRAQRSRPRRRWAVFVWDPSPRVEGRPAFGLSGWTEVPELGSYRTKKAAAEALREMAASSGAEIHERGGADLEAVSPEPLRGGGPTVPSP